MRWIDKLWRSEREFEQDGSTARPRIYDDDLFLVSYPKSGNTWMRFLLANLMRIDLEGFDAEPIDFNSAVQYVPEYELHTDAVDAAARPRILKSHTEYDASFPRVVYLVRDPRDVYVSYYHYLRKRLPEGFTLNDFLQKQDLHPCHWHEHVTGWIDQPNVLTIRYEDMLADTAMQVHNLVAYWRQRGFTDEQIDVAVSRSSFNNMKQIEQSGGRPFRSERHRELSTPFMRSGKAGAWMRHFSEGDHQLLIDRMGEQMARLGYDTEYPSSNLEVVNNAV